MAKKAKVAKTKTPKAIEHATNDKTGFAPMQFKDFTITQKRSERYAVVNAKGKNVNGADKEKILLEAKLLKPSEKKPKEAPAAT